MRRLLIRPGGIGDCILCFPAMQFLRAEYTELWISSSLVPLVQFADAVRPISRTGLDMIGVGDLELPAAVRGNLESFDEIVTWYGSERPEFRDALTRLNPHCVFHRALPNAHEHAIDFFLAQVGERCAGAVPVIRVPKPSSRETIIIQPFSGSPRKNWPLASFRELARDLPVPVEWVAGPEEELPGAVRFDDLYQLAIWMKGARLYIGNDSGITHLAAAIGMKVLALFGPTDPAIWGPRNAAVMRSESLSSLHPSEVLAKTLQVLDV